MVAFESTWRFIRLLMLSTFICSTVKGATHDPTICGEQAVSVTSDSVFQLPQAGQTIKSEIECIFIITGPNDTFLSISVNAMNIGDETDCSQDYVVLGNTVDEVNDQSNAFCGNKKGKYYFYSDGNKAYLKLKVTKNPETRSLQLLIEIRDLSKRTQDATCGDRFRTLKSGSMSFSSPVSGKTFTNATDCYYFVTTSGEKHLKFEVQKMNLHYSSGCTTNYFYAVDQRESIPTRYCGNMTLKKTIMSSTNALYIAVKVSNNVQSSFVNAKISTVDATVSPKPYSSLTFWIISLSSMLFTKGLLI